MSSALEQAIDQATSDPRVRLSMRLGALLEGGSLSGPWNAGDQGTSFGPFQIHLSLPRSAAEDPQTAVRFMAGRYAAGANQVSPGLWKADPKHAAALTAYYAERPAKMYQQARVDGAWKTLQGGGGLVGWLKGIGSDVWTNLTGGGPALAQQELGGAAGAAAGAVGSAVGSAAGAAGQAVVSKLWDSVLAKSMFVLLGLGLVALGAYQTFKPQVRAATNRAAELGGIALNPGA